MDAWLRDLVWRRAQGRCEYCQMHQDDDNFFTFHVEHIVAEQHDGADAPENLALACRNCNLSKGPNLSGNVGGRIVSLFNPRRQNWNRHFHWQGAILVGKTLAGKATIHVLNINHPERIHLRESLILEKGQFPSEFCEPD